jgi:lipopolysaccharide transport system ATP-binding protein
MRDEVLVRVDGISKKFCRNLKRSLWYGVKDTLSDVVGSDGRDQELRRDEFWAIDDVSFELRRGECLGLIGRNGAGKTTLLRMLNGLIKPDRGQVAVCGRVGGLIALGAGFNPILTGRENVYINGSVLGLSRKEIAARYDDIVEFAELGKFIDAPVQSYSSGMQVRLGFAVATALEPDVLLLDEVLAVGDAAFRAKCFDRIGTLLSRAAVIFVSHSEAQIYRICNEAMLLRGGTIVERGPPEKVLVTYRMTASEKGPSQSKVLDDQVIDAQIQPCTSTISYGDDLNVEVAINLRDQRKLGALYLHFWRNGDFASNGEILFGPKDAPTLGPGPTTLNLNVGPVNLQAGRYSLSFSAFDETRKQTIMHWLHFSDVEVHGPAGTGPPYLLPMSATVRHRRNQSGSIEVLRMPLNGVAPVQAATLT